MKRSFYLPGLMLLCFAFISFSATAAVPNITANPRDTTVCEPTPATFSITATGTAPVTYSWIVSVDNINWTLISDGGYYSGSTTTTLSIATVAGLTGYWYKGIATNTSGADTSTAAQLTVNALPDPGPISGPSIVCKGSAVSLSEALAGGSWTSSNTSVATVNGSGDVTGVAFGSATITYAATNGCGTVMTNFSIRIDTIMTRQPITGPNETCIGSSVVLMNSNVIGDAMWSVTNGRASVSSTGVVHGISAGLDTVIYNLVNACNSVTDSATVQVDAPLNAGVISGGTNVCAGSWIHLSETVGGGIWVSSDAGIAVVDASGNVTGVSTGAVVISYLMSNICGTSVATYTVSSTVAISNIAGGDSVGIGATLALSDTATGGTWSIDNTSIATINSTTGVVTGTGAGSTTVTYTVTNICGTSTATEVLYAGNAPAVAAITGPDSACISGTAAFSDATAGGAWTVSNARASIDPTGVLTGISNGFDTVYYKVTTAFGSTQVRKTVYINRPPVLSIYGPNLVSLGGNYFLYGYPAGGTFTSTPGSTLGEIIAVYNGTYTLDSVNGRDSTTINVTICSYVVGNSGSDVVTYHRTNTCGTSTIPFSMSLAGTSVNNVAGNDDALKVYPNPNSGEFTFNLVTASKEDATVSVMNMMGEKVRQLTLPTNKLSDISLDLPSGLYILSAETSTGRYTTRVTITR